MKRTIPLTDLLSEAARLIERDAKALRECHTQRGRWVLRESADHVARADYREARDIINHLRRAQRYWAANPMGGPAKVFDAIADRIRAGEAYHAVLRDYGFRVPRSVKRIGTAKKKGAKK